MAARYVRHLLRAGRPEAGVGLCRRLAPAAIRAFAGPLLSAAWRLTGDPRWDWLEAIRG